MEARAVCQSGNCQWEMQSAYPVATLELGRHMVITGHTIASIERIVPVAAGVRQATWVEIQHSAAVTA